MVGNVGGLGKEKGIRTPGLMRGLSVRSTVYGLGLTVYGLQFTQQAGPQPRRLRRLVQLALWPQHLHLHRGEPDYPACS